MLFIIEIFLGVAVGLSLAILVLILITIYCCERYQKKRKLETLLNLLGAPRSADNDGYIGDLEQYGKPDDTWDRLNYSMYSPTYVTYVTA